MRSLAAFACALTLVCAWPAHARADLPDGTQILVAGAYVLPIGCSLITGSYHVTYMIYDEGAPRRWRTAAYVCGGLSIGLGTFLLVDDGFEHTDSTVLGLLPIAIGSYAILTAWFVGAPDDIVGDEARLPVTPWFGRDAAGLAWTGTF